LVNECTSSQTTLENNERQLPPKEEDSVAEREVASPHPRTRRGRKKEVSGHSWSVKRGGQERKAVWQNTSRRPPGRERRMTLEHNEGSGLNLRKEESSSPGICGAQRQTTVNRSE
jgi:hypothetical protein